MRQLTQFLPQIAVDPLTGKIGVIWYDCRFDLAANRRTHIFASVSQDGGVTFPRDFQVQALQSDVKQDTNIFGYGDYIGLTFGNGYMHAIWADNSNSSGYNPPGAAAGETHMDVYTSKIAY